MKRGMAFVLVALCSVVVGAAAANGGSASKEKWQAPADAATKPNPESKNPAAPAVGRRLFLRTCANCHADDGSGENSSGANLRSADAQGQSDGALFWKITNGNASNGMPSFEGLRENDRWDIVVFLRTLKESGSSPAEKPEGSNKGASSKADKSDE